MHETVQSVTLDHSYHPVADYLRNLEWDGKPRVDSWLTEYLSATAPEPYLSAVSRKVLCAMVARALTPGVKFDQVPIFEGAQGVGKSTSLRVLAGDEWFSDAHINVSDKDGILSMRGAWVVELGELGGLRKADADQFKEFVSRTIDRIRVPYGRKPEAFPRQCVFIGTTNNDEYLKDATGNRRFWPINVGRCDTKGLALARDQLFAEAVYLVMVEGERLFLDTQTAQKQSQTEQTHRIFDDLWTAQISDFVIRKPDGFNADEFLLGDLFSDFGPLAGEKKDFWNTRRAAACLRMLGYERRHRLKGNFWVKKGT